jgi:selenocysteine-specific elongation factor
VEGIGTVVTGTLWSGTVRVGDILTALPGGATLRVRQVQVHDEAVPVATAGQRTALALHGVPREDLGRGDWVVAPGAFRATTLLDVRLRLLPSAERPLESRTRVRCHLGASEILGRVVLFRDDPLPPGGTDRAQLRLEEPMVAARGDRMVLRSYSPQVTVAGARVIDPSPPRRPRLSAEDVARLDALESGSAEEALAALARAAGLRGITVEEAALRLSRSVPETAEARRRAGADLLHLRDGRILSAESWREALALVTAELERYLKAHRLREGAPKGELKSLLQHSLQPATFDAALEQLLADGSLTLRGDRVSRPEAGPSLSPAQAAVLARMEQKLSSRGFQVPEAAELLGEATTPGQGQELLRYLVDSGRAVKVTSEILYPAALWEEIRSRVRAHFERRPALSMAEFKDLLQISRKYAIPLLEHLDRTGVTRREGDSRIPGPRLRA